MNQQIQNNLNNSKKLTSFLGNPNLKKVGTVYNFTKEQLIEYQNCMDDPIYFIKNYVKIVHVDQGLIPFKMWDFQEELIRLLWKERHVCGKLSRQVGKSTCVTAYFLWMILFHEHQCIAILANKGDLARELLAKIRLAYEYLPIWLQQGIVSWNKGSIELENGSRVIAAATTSAAIRGYSFTAILLDEFAFVPKNIAEEFFTSVFPTISSGKTTKLFIISTPRGLNHFFRHWNDAVKKKSDFVAYEAFWYQVPGRDQAWKEREIKNTSPEQFAQEHDCDFLGSSHTLIASSKLKEMMSATLNPIRSEGGLDIHEMPVIDEYDGKKLIPGHIYAMMVDVSRGLGLDYSAFSVIDVTTIPYKQVAKFRANDVSPLIFPTIIYNAARLYNNSYVLVEISDIGGQVADILHYELEYENVVKVQQKGKQGQQVSAGHLKKIQFGLKTSHQTKRSGCANLKTMVESDKFIIKDDDTIEELTTFISQKDSYSAEEGCHDDLAMTLVLFGWFVAQRHFKDALANDMRRTLQHQHLNILEEDVIPFGIIDNGMDNGEEFDDQGELWVEVRRAVDPFGSFDFVDWTGREI